MIKEGRDNRGRYIKGSKGHLGYEHSFETKERISKTKNKGKTDLRILPFYRNNIRNKLIELAENKCKLCETIGNATRKGNLEVHHIIPIENGGSNDIENLMLLCRKCHKKIHKEMI